MCDLFSSNTLGFETSGLLGSESLLLYARGLFHGFSLSLLGSNQIGLETGCLFSLRLLGSSSLSLLACLFLLLFFGLSLQL